MARDVFTAVDVILEELARHSALRLVARPDSTLIAFVTDESCDPFTLTDEMGARGWYVQPQLSYAGQPASVHLSVSAATHQHLDEFSRALEESLAAAIAAGPVRVDAEVVAFIESLDPTSLSDDDFDGLLVASGLVTTGDSGGLELPSAMAEVNAMLDVAAPAMREALLVAFLDRLSRPV